MAVEEIKALLRGHWTEHRPDKVRDLTDSGQLNEDLHGAASLAQDEIEHLMKHGYQEHEAREVALQDLLKPEQSEWDDRSSRNSKPSIRRIRRSRTNPSNTSSTRTST